MTTPAHNTESRATPNYNNPKILQVMTTYTTTTAPAWATTWATMPEVPTAAPAAENKKENRAALLWRVLKDYAAGTWAYTIKPAAAKAARTAAKIVAPVAFYAFRAVWMLGVLLATLGVLYGLLFVVHDMPQSVPLRFVAFFACAAVSIGFGLLLIDGTRALYRTTGKRFFAMY